MQICFWQVIVFLDRACIPLRLHATMLGPAYDAQMLTYPRTSSAAAAQHVHRPRPASPASNHSL